MRCEWSVQRARRVRICAVLAMHVPNRGIHTLWRFPCACTHLPFSSQVQRRSVCSCLRRLCIKVGLSKTLRLVLRSLHFGIHMMHGE